jgi:predicted CopG family antitoxin
MRLKNISVSETNYEKLRNLGYAGQSFNDVISELIAKSVNKQRSEQRAGNRAQTSHLSTQ